MFSVTWLTGDIKEPTGDIKEPTRLMQREEYAVNSVVVWASLGFVLHTGLTSMCLSFLDRIAQEKLLHL